MRGLILTVIVACGCGTTTVETAGGGTTAATAATPDPAAMQASVDEVTALLEQHCEAGIHTVPELLPEDGSLLIVGTAGEIMEGRETLEQVNATYAGRGITVRHDCSEVQRWVYSSDDASVVWAEEAVRTNASFPGMAVSFPAQRTFILQRTPSGWALRFYSLAVRLPDENLDEVYGLGHAGAGGSGGAGPDPAAPEASAP